MYFKLLLLDYTVLLQVTFSHFCYFVGYVWSQDVIIYWDNNFAWVVSLVDRTGSFAGWPDGPIVVFQHGEI